MNNFRVCNSTPDDRSNSEYLEDFGNAIKSILAGYSSSPSLAHEVNELLSNMDCKGLENVDQVRGTYYDSAI